MAVLCVAVACDDDNNNGSGISDEAKVTKFYLTSDSISDLKNYTFVIDNTNMLIYNLDSMDFGTDLSCVYPMMNPKFYSAYFNDSINYYVYDTVYIDFTDTVTLTVVASDKVTSATYSIIANVHQVDPDTFVWNKMSDKIVDAEITDDRAFVVGNRLVYLALTESELHVMTSEKGDVWHEAAKGIEGLDLSGFDLTGVVAIKDSLYIYRNNMLFSTADGAVWRTTATSGADVQRICFGLDGMLYGLAQVESSAPMQIAVLKGTKWIVVGDVPGGFPVSGASVMTAKSPSHKERVFFVGGIDVEGKYLSTVWSSENGAYWVELTEGDSVFKPRAYASTVQYGSKIMIFGGVDEAGDVIENGIDYSEDFGMHWSSGKGTKTDLPEEYIFRRGASALSDENGLIYVVGGKSDEGTVIADVWMGLNYKSLPGFVD